LFLADGENSDFFWRSSEKKLPANDDGFGKKEEERGSLGGE
jgi:hypothetical protein